MSVWMPTKRKVRLRKARLKLRALAVRKWSVNAVDGVVKTVEGGGDVLGETPRIVSPSTFRRALFRIERAVFLQP